ncbi:MAG TPA: hypothetical protein VM658_07230 [bacterium]|nr:hypothetical protein [bacterium]
MSEPVMVQGPKKSSWKNKLFTGLIIGGGLLVLIVIALPDFIKLSGPPPTKQSEAKQNLGAIFTTQVAYFGENVTFASGENCFDQIAWSPNGGCMYSYYCGKHELPNTACDRDCPDSTNLSVIGSDGFTVMAEGNVDKDDDCDVWTINDAKYLKNVSVDP